MAGVNGIEEIIKNSSGVNANQALFQAFNPNSDNPYGRVTTGTTNYGYVAPGAATTTLSAPSNNAEAVLFNNNVTPPGQAGADAALDASRRGEGGDGSGGNASIGSGATRGGALGDGTRGSPAEANTGISVFGGYSGAKDMMDGGGQGASTLGGTDFQGPNPNGSAGNDGPSGGK